MKKASSGGSKGSYSHKMDAKGISVKRGVGKADFGSAGANVKRPGADKVDAKRG